MIKQIIARYRCI